MLIITHDLVAQIRAHLEAGYPNEACGILIGDILYADGADKTVRAVIPVSNVWAADPGESVSTAHSQRDRFGSRTPAVLLMAAVKKRSESCSLADD